MTLAVNSQLAKVITGIDLSLMLLQSFDGSTILPHNFELSITLQTHPILPMSCCTQFSSRTLCSCTVQSVFIIFDKSLSLAYYYCLGSNYTCFAHSFWQMDNFGRWSFLVPSFSLFFSLCLEINKEEVQCICSIHSICIRTFSNFFLFILVLVHLYCHIFCFGQGLKLATFVGLVLSILQTTSLVLIRVCLFRNEIPKRNSSQVAVIYCVSYYCLMFATK